MFSGIIQDYSSKIPKVWGRGRGQILDARIFKGLFSNPRKSPSGAMVQSGAKNFMTVLNGEFAELQGVP